MFAVIYISDFLLQAQLKDPHDTSPTALVEVAKRSTGNKARIVALNHAASDLGVHAGMTAAQAQARCGTLRILHPDPESETSAREAVLKLAHDCTRDFEDTAPGICTLDLVSARVGDEWELGWTIVEELAKTHALRAQVGVAGTPDLALLIAKQADPVRSIFGDAGTDFLSTLPISALEPPADTLMVLTLWGINTVGDFLTLPEGEIIERLGTDAADLWERVAGKKSRLLRLVRPPQEFSQCVDFEHEVDSLEPLLFMMRRMLETICNRLTAAWLSAGDIDLKLHFSTGTGYQRRFRIPNPTTDVELLFRVLHAHLENFEARAPIESVRLEAFPARGAKRQFHLFESGLRDPNRFAETLARLEALLGSDRVGVPERLNTHRADAIRMRPFQPGERSDTQGNSESEPAFKLGLPLRRFRPPIAAQVTTQPPHNHPVFLQSTQIKGAISDRRGPWMNSGDWWTKRSRWKRAEWDVELTTGGLFRLVCEHDNEWKLEGVYG